MFNDVITVNLLFLFSVSAVMIWDANFFEVAYFGP